MSNFFQQHFTTLSFIIILQIILSLIFGSKQKVTYLDHYFAQSPIQSKMIRCKTSSLRAAMTVVSILILMRIIVGYFKIIIVLPTPGPTEPPVPTPPPTKIPVPDPDIYQYNPFEMKLRWCDTLKSNGLGNKLANYWYYRSVAFWLNLTFENDFRCSCNERQRVSGIHFCNNASNKTIWTQYLPAMTNGNFTIRYLLENENNTIYNNSEISIKGSAERRNYLNLSILVQQNLIKAVEEHKDLKIMHSSENLISVLNTLFLKIVQPEMNYAFELYYNQSHDKPKQVMLNNIYKNDILALHWRCGDILNGHTYHYGFNGLSYYEDALKSFGLSNKANNNLSVHILVNLNKKAKTTRKGDANFFDKCETLLNSIMDKLGQIFKSFGIRDIKVLGNGTMNSDQYLLSTSKYVICGLSTFCEMAVIGNNNKNIVIMSNDIEPTRNWSKYIDYFPKYIHTLSTKDRFIHPGANNVESNLSIIAEYINTH